MIQKRAIDLFLGDQLMPDDAVVQGYCLDTGLLRVQLTVKWFDGRITCTTIPAMAEFYVFPQDSRMLSQRIMSVGH